MEWFTLYKNGLAHLVRLTRRFACCDLCSADVYTPGRADSIEKQSLLCRNCFNDLPLFNQQLVHGDLLQWPAIYHALPNISFDHLFSLAPYTAPFDTWLVEFKYQGRFELAAFFARLLARQWQAVIPDSAHAPVELVLSVPVHIKRWQTRGYNQAHLIAQAFAQQLILPYMPLALVRMKQNSSQVGKTGGARRKNLGNAFVLKQGLPTGIKHVILVDDVLTTGSTASEITRLLKKAGVETVTIVTVCLSLAR